MVDKGNNSGALEYLGTVVSTIDHPAEASEYNPLHDYEAIIKGFRRTDVPADILTTILSTRTALQIDALSDFFKVKGHPLGLCYYLNNRTADQFRHLLSALAKGPLYFDVHLLLEALEYSIRPVTCSDFNVEKILIEVLLGRESSDILLLQEIYRQKVRKPLLYDIEEQFTGDAKRMFSIALLGERPTSSEKVQTSVVDEDAKRLHRAAASKDASVFIEILVNRTNDHIGLLRQIYDINYDVSLSKTIKKKFSGTVRDGLLHLLRGGNWSTRKPGHRDAKLIHKALKGFSINHEALIWRIVRAHWDSSGLTMWNIKMAYMSKYEADLEDTLNDRISDKKEVYRNLLIALVAPDPRIRY